MKPYCTMTGQIQGLVFSNLSIERVKNELEKEEERKLQSQRKREQEARSMQSLIVRETHEKFSDLWKTQIKHTRPKLKNRVMT